MPNKSTTDSVVDWFKEILADLKSSDQNRKASTPEREGTPRTLSPKPSSSTGHEYPARNSLSPPRAVFSRHASSSSLSDLGLGKSESDTFDDLISEIHSDRLTISDEEDDGYSCDTRRNSQWSVITTDSSLPYPSATTPDSWDVLGRPDSSANPTRSSSRPGSFRLSFDARMQLLNNIRNWDDESPCIEQMKLLQEGLDDWDIIQSSDVSYYRNTALSPGPVPPTPNETSRLLGAALGVATNPLEDTFNKVQRALNIPGSTDRKDQSFKYLVPPLKDEDFHKYLDECGRLVKPDELRLLIYQIGVEHSLRKVVWKHLLNVYPCGLSGQQRMDYMKAKCLEYEELKKRWQHMNWEEKKQVVTMIRKDVLRTDRSHAFYTDIDMDFETNPTNPHLTSLFDILMTFAMSFPQVSYCQGMSDLASPLLLIMQDEAVTYVCFCALMRRLRPNFALDSQAMRTKFEHLKLLLRHVDAEFYHYLSSGVENFELFFCYRWLLLEMKREFALDDALLMLEVMWASIPPDPPQKEILLANQTVLSGITTSHFHISPSASKVNALSSNPSDENYHLNPLDATNVDLISWSREENQKPSSNTSKDSSQNFDHLSQTFSSLEVNSSADHCSNSSSNGLDSKNCNDILEPISTSTPARTIEKSESSAGNQHMPTDPHLPLPSTPRTPISPMKVSSSCPSLDEILEPAESPKARFTFDEEEISTQGNQSQGTECLPDSALHHSSSFAPSASTQAGGGGGASPNPAKPVSRDVKRAKSTMNISPNAKKTPDSGNVFRWDDSGISDATGHNGVVNKGKVSLPCPADFGCGNPFLLFMCVTLIIQQKQAIMSQGLDFTEVHSWFYRLVRSHDVHKVLGHARMLFADYLRTQPWKTDSDC